MFCTHCGKQISDDSKFCEFCGHNVLEDNEQQGQPASSPAEASPASSAPQAAATQQPMPKKSAKENKGKIIIAVLACILVASLYTFIQTGKRYDTVQKAAKCYQTYYNEKEWGKVYDMTKGDHEFISRDDYINIMETKASPEKLGKPSVSAVRSSTKANESAIDFDGSVKELTFVKRTKKRYLFFDDWECKGLAPEDNAIGYYYIPYVDGTTVSFDGVTVPESKRTTLENDGVSGNYYKIKSVVGKHKISYDDPEGLLAKNTYSVTRLTSQLAEEGNDTTINLKYSEKTLNESKEALKKIINDFIPYVGDEEPDVSMFSQGFLNKNDAKDFMDNISFYSFYTIKTRPSVTNVSIELTSDSYGINYSAKVDFTYTTDDSYAPKESDNIELSVTMERHDGQWKITRW